jgi:hypothetical protein
MEFGHGIWGKHIIMWCPGVLTDYRSLSISPGILDAASELDYPRSFRLRTLRDHRLRPEEEGVEVHDQGSDREGQE